MLNITQVLFKVKFYGNTIWDRNRKNRRQAIKYYLNSIKF